MIGSLTCGSGGRAALSGGYQRISLWLGARRMSTGGGTHLTDEGEGRLSHGKGKGKKNGRRMEFAGGTVDQKNKARWSCRWLGGGDSVGDEARAWCERHHVAMGCAL
jgi:hypothetical protein